MAVGSEISPQSAEGVGMGEEKKKLLCEGVSGWVRSGFEPRRPQQCVQPQLPAVDYCQWTAAVLRVEVGGGKPKSLVQPFLVSQILLL